MLVAPDTTQITQIITVADYLNELILDFGLAAYGCGKLTKDELIQWLREEAAYGRDGNGLVAGRMEQK